MKLTNEKLIKILSKYKQTLSVENYYKGLIFNSVEINKIILDKKNIIQNLQYLSLSNNNITHIDFIIHLQNLYYLDIINNPIIEFEPLNIKISLVFYL
jgi:Leucine-rich repeat (LRR) protein